MSEPKVVHEWEDDGLTHVVDENGLVWRKKYPNQRTRFPEGKELARLAARVEDLEGYTLQHNVETVKAENQRLQRDVGELLDALIWCSGSADFGPGGEAHKGWVKTCRPLIERLIPKG